MFHSIALQLPLILFALYYFFLPTPTCRSFLLFRGLSRYLHLAAARVAPLSPLRLWGALTKWVALAYLGWVQGVCEIVICAGGGVRPTPPDSSSSSSSTPETAAAAPSPAPASSSPSSPSAEASSSPTPAFDSPPSSLPEQTAAYSTFGRIWENYITTPKAASPASPSFPTWPVGEAATFSSAPSAPPVSPAPSTPSVPSPASPPSPAAPSPAEGAPLPLPMEPSPAPSFRMSPVLSELPYSEHRARFPHLPEDVRVQIENLHPLPKPALYRHGTFYQGPYQYFSPTVKWVEHGEGNGTPAWGVVPVRPIPTSAPTPPPVAFRKPPNWEAGASSGSAPSGRGAEAGGLPHPTRWEPSVSSPQRVDTALIPAPSARRVTAINLPAPSRGEEFTPLPSPVRVWDASVIPTPAVRPENIPLPLSPRSGALTVRPETIPLPPSPVGGSSPIGTSPASPLPGSPAGSSPSGPSSLPSSPLPSPRGSRYPSVDWGSVELPSSPSSPPMPDPAAVPPSSSGAGSIVAIVVGVVASIAAVWGVYRWWTRKPAPPADGKQPPSGETPPSDATTPPPSDGGTPPPPADPDGGEDGGKPPSAPSDAEAPSGGASAIAVEEAAPFMEFTPPRLTLFRLLFIVGLSILRAFVTGHTGYALLLTALRRISRLEPAPGEPTRIGAALKRFLHRLRRWWRP